MRVHLSTSAAALFLAWAAPLSGERAPDSFVAARFDDLPEGLVVDSRGTLYASLLTSGRIARVLDTGRYEIVSHVVPSHVKGATLGIDIGPDGRIYVIFVEASKRFGLINFFDSTNRECKDATVTRTGIYRVDPKSGVSQPLVTRAEGWPFCFLDDLAVSSTGDMYVTDMTYSGIWKISAEGRKVAMWSPFSREQPVKPRNALAATGAVNPIVLDEQNRAVYVGTILNGMVVRLPILPDGSAGEPEAVAQGFGSIDGLELAPGGDLYVTDNMHSEIWRVTLDGKRTLVADAHRHMLRENSNLAWWRGRLCTANTEFSMAQQIDKASRSVVCIKGR